MKLSHLKLCFLFYLLSGSCFSQEKEDAEQYGNTINIGFGYGYYPYVGYPVTALVANSEINLERNTTVAPFVAYYSYEQKYYWGNESNEFRYYQYSEKVIPLALKVSYYFDELIHVPVRWDLYAAASFGFIFRKTTWESTYHGPKQINPGMGPLFIDAHLGAEYHFTKKLGVQLDLSTGMATCGLALHL